MWLLSVLCDRPSGRKARSPITTLNPRYIYGVNPKSFDGSLAVRQVLQ
ncbi:hypothetical protein [Nostoc sp.]